jgi:hypothetical protein
MVFSNNLLLGATGAAGGYTIDQSIRFNSADSSYLSRTPSSDPTGGDASGAKQFTVSVWLKRGKLSVAQAVFAANTSVNSAMAVQLAGASGSTLADQIDFDQESGGSPRDRMIPSALYRDVSAWYHLCLMVDTTQATAANRFKIAINGVLVSNWYTNDPPALDAYFQWNMNGVLQRIGSNSHNVGNLFDGYMAEFHNVDGVAAETSFGEFNDDGVWVPKAYTGTYGTNGFYITGEDSADLGADYSGNGNDFTSSGLTSDDQVIDTPTDNYATWSAIQPNVGTLANGSLQITALTNKTAVSTFRMDSGKWIASAKSSAGSSQAIFGLWQDMGTVPPASDPGFNVNSWAWYIAATAGNRGVWTNSVKLFTVATLDNTYDMLVAVDIDAGKMWFGTDIGGTTVWYNSSGGTTGDPATGANPTATFTAGSPMYFAGQASVNTITANFGQSSFAYTPPTGFKFLSTANLPAPVIKDGSAYFQPTLYTGNGTAIGSGGNAVTQIGNSTFQPDFVWMKSRSAATDHALYDAVRGTTKEVISSSTAIESTLTEGLTTFGAAGFTVGSDAAVNTNAATYAAWQWLANGSGSSNTDGATSSTVSANQTAGFSVVTYTGTGSATTIGHGLGVVPQFIAIKGLTGGADSWGVYPGTSTGYGGQYRLKLNETSSVAASSVYWNNTDATSSVFTVNTDAQVNGSSVNYVAYCWAEVAGYSKIGRYTGNGNANGPFVWCGFKPAYILIKNTTSAYNWTCWDTARSPINPAENELYPNVANAEVDGNRPEDFVSNGFKIRNDNVTWNANGSTYIFMAFAEHPFGGDGVAPATAR